MEHLTAFCPCRLLRERPSEGSGAQPRGAAITAHSRLPPRWGWGSGRPPQPSLPSPQPEPAPSRPVPAAPPAPLPRRLRKGPRSPDSPVTRRRRARCFSFGPRPCEPSAEVLLPSSFLSRRRPLGLQPPSAWPASPGAPSVRSLGAHSGQPASPHPFFASGSSDSAPLTPWFRVKTSAPLEA